MVLMVANIAKPKHFPLSLRDDEVAGSVIDLANLIIRESDLQVADKIEDARGIDELDFCLSCDALNYWRMDWRCEEEWGRHVADAYQIELADHICSLREYDPEEFELALQATKERVRIPYGLQPLEVAYRRVLRNPVRLIAPELQSNQLLAKIAGLAINLRELEYRSYILLPIENLRQLFNCRKVAITGAIMVLLKHGVLEDTGAKYGKNRARQFSCKAEESVHFEFVNSK